MAGLMDMINNTRDMSTDKSMAETTMQCLKEMKRQSTENVELVKSINSLVEAGITKIKGIEVGKSNSGNFNEYELKNELKSELEEIKVIAKEQNDLLKSELKNEFVNKLGDFSEQLEAKIEKENNKCYKNVESILEEYIQQQERVNKSHTRWLKVITWFLVLIAALLTANIVGVF